MNAVCERETDARVIGMDFPSHHSSRVALDDLDRISANRTSHDLL